MKQINMYIPDDLRRAFKVATAKEGKSMVEVIREFMSDYVSEKQREKTA